MRSSLSIPIALLLGVMIATSAGAADAPAVRSEAKPVATDGWVFSVSPYFWGAGLSGDVAQFGLPEVHVESSFGDIFKDLDFAFMAVGEARRDRVSLVVDVTYTKVSTGTGTPRGIVTDRVDLRSETFTGFIGAGYALVHDARGHLDVVAGARVWDARTDLSFVGGVLHDVAASDRASWVDAMAGVRGRYRLADRVYVTGWGLVGAGQSDLDWDVGAGIGYEASDRISMVAGYRALGVDYRHRDFVYDVVQQGPIVGMVMRF